MDITAVFVVLALLLTLWGVLFLYVGGRIGRDGWGFKIISSFGFLYLAMAHLTMFPALTTGIDATYNNCEWLQNQTDKIYVYGDNYTGEHWTYSDAPNGPPQSNNPINVFHMNETLTWYNTCDDLPPIVVNGIYVYGWLIIIDLLGLFWGAAFMVYAWLRRVI